MAEDKRAHDALVSDEELRSHITTLLCDDPWLTQAIADWVAAYKGVEPGTDVSERDDYWDLYTFRLLDLTIKALSGMVNMPKQEELVF